MNISTGVTGPRTQQPGDTGLDRLNEIIGHMKGVRIFTYCYPTNPNKEKEPILHRALCKKFLPPRSEEQKQWNEQESEARAALILNKQPKEETREEKMRIKKPT